MPKEIRVQGKHNIPGRGVVFVADRREQSFELLDLKKGDSIIVKDALYEFRGLECFRRNTGVAPVVGIQVKEV